MSIQATLICGNPTTPCSGIGVCDLQSQTAKNYLPGAHNIFVNVDVDANSNLVITIPSKSVGMVNMMTTIISSRIFATAANFYIDKSLNSLWPNLGPEDWVLMPGGASCPVTGPDSDGSYSFTVPVDATPGQRGGLVGNIINHGQLFPADYNSPWNVGTDFYGNLVFKYSGTNVILGAAGNMRIHGLNVQTTACNAPLPGALYQLQTEIIPGSWTMGTDDTPYLVITNNTNILFFDTSGNGYLAVGGNVMQIQTTPLTSTFNPIGGRSVSFETNPAGVAYGFDDDKYLWFDIIPAEDLGSGEHGHGDDMFIYFDTNGDFVINNCKVNTA